MKLTTRLRSVLIFADHVTDGGWAKAGVVDIEAKILRNSRLSASVDDIVAVAESFVSASWPTGRQLKVNISAILENQTTKTIRQRRIFTFQYPNGGAQRTSVDARRRRSRVLRVRIVVYNASIEG